MAGSLRRCCMLCVEAQLCAICLQAGQHLHLSSLVKRAPEALAAGDHIRGAVIIDESAELGQGCSIGPDVSIGPGCNIGNGVRLSNCVVMKGCKVCPRALAAFRMLQVAQIP